MGRLNVAVLAWTIADPFFAIYYLLFVITA
jgi:hypothetical protein